jgi:hypothetical protein
MRQDVAPALLKRVIVRYIRQNLKQKAAHEVREYLVISFYLFVVFSLFVVHKSLILAEHHIDYTLHGFALINALALAKIVLVAQDLHLGDQFRDAPLIYPTLMKSFAFTVVLAVFKVAEDAIVGGFRGRSLQESLADIGGSWAGVATIAALMFVMLIPFFGFTELQRVFGADRLIGVFFRPRRLWSLPSIGS